MKSLKYKFQKKNFYRERKEEVGKYYALQIQRRISSKKFDLIFSPGTIPIAFLDTTIPIIFWTDATFASMVNYYFTDICEESIKDGNRMEKSALNRCMLAIYSSDWAADSAINDYHTDPEKVKIIPFGANIQTIPESVYIRRGPSNPLQILFVGRDWVRKGGEVCFETLVALNDMGINCELTILGCIPPKKFKHPQLKVYSFLDKNNQKDYEAIQCLYKKADFVILPSKKECSPVVLCEANAFGVPVLATHTGGIPTIVKSGVNGFTLPLEARGFHYAIKIRDIIANEEYYKNLRLSARKRFDEVLNWDTAGKKVMNLIYQKIS